MAPCPTCSLSAFVAPCLAVLHDPDEPNWIDQVKPCERSRAGGSHASDQANEKQQVDGQGATRQIRE
jgi:hypothetical protein